MQHQRGLSLVELMVSMAIGLFLVGGALTVYIEGRESYELNETIARMQENATFALKQLEPDIQLAGFWGTHNRPNEVGGRAQVDASLVVNVANECDPEWSIRVREFLVGTNNERPAWNCITDDDYRIDTDVLTVRRASSSPAAALDDGRLYIRSSTLPHSELFIGGGPAPPFPADSQDFPLLAHAYYVNRDSVGAEGMPSLRRLTLSHVGTAMVVRDLEVVQGVEDMQIQFGVDTIGDGAADAYVDADSPLLAGNTVRSVRVWLLLRSERPELGYVDDATYVLGDVSRTPTADDDPTNDAFRRMLVSRTIQLRN